MILRRVVFLLALSLLCIVTVGYLPRGTAPYSVVYGPASAFRAERAILMLTIAILKAVKLIVFFFAFLLSGLRVRPVLTVSFQASDFALLTSALRC